jgi:site-specific DNA recombinase
MNAIIYIRVSTTDQVELGNSLKVQEEICLEYAKRNNFNVLKIFKEEGESAKSTKRTELTKLLNYIQLKNGQINYLLVYKLDRLSRNLLDYANLISLLSKYGIILKSATETTGDTPEGKLMQNIIASFAQYDNDQRSNRTKSGMMQAVKEGRWVWNAPFGYEYKREDGKKFYLIPSEDKGTIINIFNDFINGKKQVEILEELKSKGYKFSKQRLNEVLRNPLYIGKIKTSFFPDVKDGIHEPIISEETFYKAQKMLNGKGDPNNKSKISKDFPLRKFLKCPECSKNLAGSWSKGWSKKYPYYHCVNKGCGFKPIRKEKAEEIFLDYLYYIKPDKDKIIEFLATMKKIINEQEKDNKLLRNKINKQLRELEQNRNKIEEYLIDGTFTKDRFNRKIKEVEEKIEEKKIELNSVGREIIDSDSTLKYCEYFLNNISSLWITGDINTKRAIQDFIFPEGAYIEDGTFRTDKIATIFKVFDKKNYGKSNLVSLGRFELPTPGLGILCSIHLSYRDTEQ